MQEQKPIEPETGLHFLDYWRVIRSRKEIILVVWLLVVLLGTLYTWRKPNLYRSQVRIEIRDDELDVDVFERRMGYTYNPFFLRTQFEIIQSAPIMERVAANLDLPQKWAETGRDGNRVSLPMPLVVNILSRSIRVDQARDTSLVSISVTRPNPQEAADIANMVAEVYRDHRLAVKNREIRRGLDAVQLEIEKQRGKVDLAERELERLRQEFGIAHISRGVRVDKIRLQSLEADRIAARVDMISRKARLQELERLSDEELLQAMGYIINDQEVIALRRQLMDTELQIRVLGETLGDQHPDMRRMVAARSELKDKMTAALNGLKAGMRMEHEVAASRYKALEAELEAAREADILSEGASAMPFEKAQEEVNMQRQFLLAMTAKVTQEMIKLGGSRTPVEFVDRAIPNNRPVSPNLWLNLMISFFVGLGAGVGLAYFIEYLDTSVKTVNDVESHLGLPVIGVIPQKVRPLIEEGPESPYMEAYRVLRTNLMFANKEQRGGVFSVASGGVGEGKSTTVFNLAYVCAMMGDKVLIVDSDLRRPVQHTILGMPNKFGLTNVLMRDVPIEETIKTVPNVPNLHFLPSGRLPRSSVGVLNALRVRDLVKNLRARYDYVFLDSPPIVGVSDSSILASEVDGVLLVVQYRKYPRMVSTRARRVIENVGGKLVGVVLNNINIMRDDYYYYYHSYSSHYYARPGESEPAASASLPQPSQVSR